MTAGLLLEYICNWWKLPPIALYDAGMVEHSQKIWQLKISL